MSIRYAEGSSFLYLIMAWRIQLEGEGWTKLISCWFLFLFHFFFVPTFSFFFCSTPPLVPGRHACRNGPRRISCGTIRILQAFRRTNLYKLFPDRSAVVFLHSCLRRILQMEICAQPVGQLLACYRSPNRFPVRRQHFDKFHNYFRSRSKNICHLLLVDFQRLQIRKKGSWKAILKMCNGLECYKLSKHSIEI